MDDTKRELGTDNSMYFQDVCDRNFGRKVITFNIDNVTESNIIEVLEKAMPIHKQNAREIVYLKEYVKGHQPILHRVKEIRPEIKNIIVENHAKEIVDFYTAQMFCDEIKYTSKSDQKQFREQVQSVVETLSAANKSHYDNLIGQWQATCGTAYRFVYYNKNADKEMGESIIGIDVPDPSKTFIIYKDDFSKRPLCSVTMSKDIDGKDYLYCMTNEFIYEVYLQDKIVKPSTNNYKRIMMTEFPRNEDRIGDVEIVITLLDKINTIQANRVDGVEQFIQSFMKFVNCEIDKDTFNEMRKVGAITIKSNENGLKPEVDIMSAELDQMNTRNLLDDLYAQMLIISNIPSREQNTGGDTGQAVSLRNGWGMAEQVGKTTEKIIKMSEQKSLMNILSILKVQMPDEIKSDLKVTDFNLSIPKNKTDGMLSKVQAYQGLVASGIHPKIAIKVCSLFDDPDGVYTISLPYIERYLKEEHQAGTTLEVTE